MDLIAYSQLVAPEPEPEPETIPIQYFLDDDDSIPASDDDTSD